MAYFACSRAARTGTDRLTRASIAKGTVKPTFVNRNTGKTTLRGVVQADVVTGRDTGYVTASSRVSRARAAINATSQANKGAVATIKAVVKTVVHPTAPKTNAVVTSLYSEASGIVGNTGIASLSKKTMVVGGLIVGAILFVVIK